MKKENQQGAIKNDLGKDPFDVCIVCGAVTEVPKGTPIEARLGYINGAGQLCLTCWREMNKAAHHL